ncbi:hypothetical protein DDZ18_04750 [Marinicauda salina]|uniref:Uncharacterized protein n=1 Tax=Marinicauda salina TaxID=2135793 RepID=A0A2U2BV49_9PROT|nr:hypothetical protein [Marinicauda salina]PWE17888.1 hypothetical protein DDZ18_04750 [Marinicauda salina]
MNGEGGEYGVGAGRDGSRPDSPLGRFVDGALSQASLLVLVFLVLAAPLCAGAWFLFKPGPDAVVAEPGRAFGEGRGRLAAAESALDDAEAALRTFLDEEGVADFTTERRLALEHAARLETRLAEARSDRAAAHALRDALDARIAELPEEITLSTENALGERLLALEARRAELLSRYEDDAAPVGVVDREIAALRAFIEAGAGERAGRRRTGPNPVRQELVAEVARTRSRLAGMESQINRLEQEVEAAREAVDRFVAKSAEHERLARAVARRRAALAAAQAAAPGRAGGSGGRPVEPDLSAYAGVASGAAAALFASGLVAFVVAGLVGREPPPEPPRTPSPSPRPPAASQRGRSRRTPGDEPELSAPVLARLPEQPA